MVRVEPLTPGVRENALLLVTHVPIRRGPHGYRIDDQTAAGIAQWCRHFEKVTYYGISVDDVAGSGASSSTWVDVGDFAPVDRLEMVGLPSAYRLRQTVTNYRKVKAELALAVSDHRYLCFTLGSLIGDWPSLAAAQAIAQDLPYAAWLDRDEADVIRNKLETASLAKRLAGFPLLPVIEAKTRYLLRRSRVSLLQGLDTYKRHVAHATDPHVTYDTHTHVSDQISRGALATKLKRISEGGAIEIVYVGRAAAMKGPGDWLHTLEQLHREGVPFRATWLGDGPDLPGMMNRVRDTPLADCVHFHGFEGDREVVLERMRDSDIMLFCHKTPESPRCLIEALVCGTPLVGYGSAYPEGLVEARGGGLFAPQNDSAALCDRIAGLHRDRDALARLVTQAAASGELYNEDSVYGHRAELMKRADAFAGARPVDRHV